MEPPGNVVVEARWPDELDADVDLWVQGPGDVPGRLLQQRRRSCSTCCATISAARSDATELNYEVAYSRGVAAGEYIVNVHLYRNNAPGDTRCRSRWSPASSAASASASRQLLTSKVELGARGPGADGVPLPPGRQGRAGARQRPCAAAGSALLEAVMSSLTLLFAAAVVAGALPVEHRRLGAAPAARPSCWRWRSAALFLPLGYVAGAELLSRPKPVAHGMAWAERRGERYWARCRRRASTSSSGCRLDGDGRAARLRRCPGAGSWPSSCRVPSGGRPRRRTDVRMRAPFGGEPSLDDGEPRFYAAPQLPCRPRPKRRRLRRSSGPSPA